MLLAAAALVTGSAKPQSVWEPTGTNLKCSKVTGAVCCKSIEESCNATAKKSRRRCGKAKHLRVLREASPKCTTGTEFATQVRAE